MKKLLCAELYKLSRDWLLAGALVLMAVLCIAIMGRGAELVPRGTDLTVYQVKEITGRNMQSVVGFWIWQERQMVRSILGNTVSALWCGAILATLLIGQDFETRTAEIAILRGHTRRGIFYSKLLLFYGTGLLFSFTTLLLSLYFFVPEWIRHINRADLLLDLALRTVCDLGILSITFFFAYLCRDLIKTASFSAGHGFMIFFLEGQIIESRSKAMTILQWHPFLKLNAMLGNWPDMQGAGRFAVIAGGLFLVLTAAAWMLYRRVELK